MFYLRPGFGDKKCDLIMQNKIYNVTTCIFNELINYILELCNIKYFICDLVSVTKMRPNHAK